MSDEDVLEKAGNGHRANTARDGRDVTDVFEIFKVCVATESFFPIAIDPNINDGDSRLYHTGSD